MIDRNDPCTRCEFYMFGIECDEKNCLIFKMKEENKKLKASNRRLKAEISRLKSYDNATSITIGDVHEMGAW